MNNAKIAEACDKAAKRCSQIPLGQLHGSAWLFDQVMRAFDDPAIVGVNYDVYINLVGKGEITIDREGNLFMKTKEVQDNA